MQKTHVIYKHFNSVSCQTFIVPMWDYKTPLLITVNCDIKPKEIYLLLYTLQINIFTCFRQVVQRTLKKIRAAELNFIHIKDFLIMFLIFKSLYK